MSVKKLERFRDNHIELAKLADERGDKKEGKLQRKFAASLKYAINILNQDG